MIFVVLQYDKLKTTKINLFFKNFTKNMLNSLKDFLDIANNFLSPPFLTGVGIIIGNSAINFFRRKNEIKDKSKIFALVVQNQLDDLYNIKRHITTIKSYLEALNIEINKPLQTNTDKDAVKITEIIKQKSELMQYRVSSITSDSLYLKILEELYVYEGNNLSSLVKYSRKLRILMEDLKNFISHDIPVKIEEYKRQNQFKDNPQKINQIVSPVHQLEKRCDIFLTQLNLTLCYAFKSIKILKNDENSYDQYSKEIKQEIEFSISQNQELKEYFEDNLKYLNMGENVQKS
jgi:hypothetical protein